MQKKFLHELLCNPGDDFFKLIHAQAMTRAYSAKHKLDGFPTDIFFHCLDQLKFKAPKERLLSNLQRLLSDPGMSHMAIAGSIWCLGDTPKSFVFAKEFFSLLMRAKIDNIRWSMLEDKTNIVMRFPVPILDDDGDPIHEVAVMIKPRAEIEALIGSPYTEQDGEGSRVLLAVWRCGKDQDSLGYLSQLVPDDQEATLLQTFRKRYIGVRGSEMVMESDNPDDLSTYIQACFSSGANLSRAVEWKLAERSGIPPYIMAIFKCLIYLHSGDPDLRDEKNPIKYQSPTSKTPVRAHKEFSELPFSLVGFNWLKTPDYEKESWEVVPHLRYVSRGESHRFVLVRGHVRHRRAGSEPLPSEFSAPSP